MPSSAWKKKPRIFITFTLNLLLVWLIFVMVLIKLLTIIGTISGKTVKLMVLSLICLGNKRQDLHLHNCMFSCLQILEAFLWFFFFSNKKAPPNISTFTLPSPFHL